MRACLNRSQNQNILQRFSSVWSFRYWQLAKVRQSILQRFSYKMYSLYDIAKDCISYKICLSQDKAILILFYNQSGIHY